MATAGEAAQDITRVLDALDQASFYVAGHDQADAARTDSPQVRHSPLRTILDHAGEAARRVEAYLAHRASDASPGTSRDGGPL